MASIDDVKVWVRMPKEIHVLVASQAEAERRSINAQILVLLERALAVGGALERRKAQAS